jgi:uncharacterized protein (UPF0248 family)
VKGEGVGERAILTKNIKISQNACVYQKKAVPLHAFLRVLRTRASKKPNILFNFLIG